MPTELTDEEVFGGSPTFPSKPGELSDADVWGGPPPEFADAGATPMPPTKENRLFQGINAGDVTGLSPSKVFKGAAPILGAVALPEALVSAFPELAPSAATGILGYLGRLGVLNTVGAGASSVLSHTPDVLSGKESPSDAAGRVALETGIGGLGGTLAGPLAQKGLQGAQGGVEALFGPPLRTAGEILPRFGKGAGVGLLRPLFESTADAEAQAASKFIEQATGIKPARSMGEALGKTSIRGKSYLEIENELGDKATGALSPEARNDITRAVLHTATNLAGEAPTPSNLAEATVAGIQEAIGTQISGPTRKAVQEISDHVSSSLRNAAEATGQQGMRLTAPGAATTGYEAGNIGKMATEDAARLFKEREDQLYGNYRALLGNNPPSADLSNSEREAGSILSKGLKVTDPNTGIVTINAKTIPEGETRKFIEHIQQSASTPQDIETLRQFRTTVGESYGHNDMFPGLGDANKGRLYGALSKDIDAAIAKIPNTNVRDALKTANDFVSNNIDLFKSNLGRGAAGEVISGGKTGQGLLNNVLGDADRYKAFQSILGDQFGTFQQSARDYVLTGAQSAATNDLGEFSVGKALDAVKKLPSEVANDLFPGLTQNLGTLAKKELQVAGLQKALPKDPEKALDWITANKADLNQFLAPGGDQKLADAIRLKAAERVRFHNAVLSDVAQGKADTIAKYPEKFVDSLMDGSYSRTGDVSEALNAAAQYHPAVYEHLQREYLSRLFGDSTVDGVISGEQLAAKLSPSTGGASAKSAGESLKTATEILGKAKVDSLRAAADAIGKTQKSLLGQPLAQRQTALEFMANAKTPMDAAFIIGSKAGMARTAARAAARLINRTAEWKYKFAARLANNPETLPLLSKPIANLSGAEASEIINAMIQEEMNR
jgi:hypothetical protein